MVEMTYLAIIGIALAAMFFGYGFGLFEGRGQGYKKRKTEEEQEPKEKREPASDPSTVTVEVDDPGLLRIKNENGYLTLDLDGTRVDTSSLSSDQRKRLIEMLNLIRPWLESKSAPPTVTPPSYPQPAPVLDARQGTPVISPPATPRPAVQPVAQTQDKPSASTARSERPAAPANSIVGQIDSILQQHLAGTPLEERGIFLAQSPEGGVNVYVGLTRYNGVEDVPDAEIKAAIRAAISDWEDKYTPGFK